MVKRDDDIYHRIGIYGIRNLINGKIYVGKTGMNFGDRWDSHRSVLNNGKPGQSFIGGSKRILHMASKLFYLVNKSDEEIARNGLERGNQTLWLAFQRSGSSDLPPINIYNNKHILRMEEV